MAVKLAAFFQLMPNSAVKFIEKNWMHANFHGPPTGPKPQINPVPISVAPSNNFNPTGTSVAPNNKPTVSV